jgi:hypothetical protein
MKSHEFRLVLAGISDVSMDDADALFEAGCGDASFGSCEGVAFGDFDREAETLEVAIRSAIADIQRAGLNVARLEHVEQTLVSEINAELAAVTEA